MDVQETNPYMYKKNRKNRKTVYWLFSFHDITSENKITNDENEE